jgi:molecular chaperone DnaK
VVSFSPPEVLVGRPAAAEVRRNPANTFFNVKRLLGRQVADPAVQEELSRLPFAVQQSKSGQVLLVCPALSRSLAPEAVSSLLVRHLVSFAEAAHSQLEPPGEKTPVQAVVAVPTRFTDAQRQATSAAVKAAGVELLRLVNEPTAAALAYGFGASGDGAAGENDLDDVEEQLVLVFDLGGGTLDVSVLDVGCGVFQVLASSGDSYLGGNDFDAAVVSWIREQQRAAGIPDREGPPTPEVVAAAEAAKIALSEEAAVVVALDPSSRQLATLTRDELERRTEPLLQRCAAILREVLADAQRTDETRIDAQELAAVLLVGGATRMPAVRELVQEVTGHAPLSGVDPDEVVALGCAIHAAALVGTIDRGDAILLDETPEADDLKALLEKMNARLAKAKT